MKTRNTIIILLLLLFNIGVEANDTMSETQFNEMVKEAKYEYLMILKEAISDDKTPFSEGATPWDNLKITRNTEYDSVCDILKKNKWGSLAKIFTHLGNPTHGNALSNSELIDIALCKSKIDIIETFNYGDQKKIHISGNDADKLKEKMLELQGKFQTEHPNTDPRQGIKNNDNNDNNDNNSTNRVELLGELFGVFILGLLLGGGLTYIMYKKKRLAGPPSDKEGQESSNSNDTNEKANRSVAEIDNEENIKKLEAENQSLRKQLEEKDKETDNLNPTVENKQESEVLVETTVESTITLRSDVASIITIAYYRIRLTNYSACIRR